MDKFIRNDHPSGKKGGYGSRWILASGKRGDEVETYVMDHPDYLGIRLSMTDFLVTGHDRSACICMDPAAAIEFAQEVIRQAQDVLQKEVDRNKLK